MTSCDKGALRHWSVVVLIWVVVSAAMIFHQRGFIATLSFRDSDDALRLVEVRDWMAGQSWFDTIQHRINPPHSVPMHWSRLVDVPIAAVIAAASLFVAPGVAERIALVAIPLLTFLALFVTVAKLVVRVTHERLHAVVAVAMLGMSIGVNIQFQVLRIDHHGWQILLDTMACLLVLGTGRGKAVLAGLVMALSLTIALEGMPIALGVAGVLALRFLRNETEGPALVGYLVGLAAGGCALVALTLGLRGAAVPWCDTLSPAYLLPMGMAALALPLALRLVGTDHRARRAACLAGAGIAAAIVFLTGSHQCAAGPFAMLDPVVYKLWYTSIGEGMPAWKQSADVAALVPMQALVGLAGTALAIRSVPADQKRTWIELLLLQLLSFAVSLVVMRAMGLAHVLALPGAAWLFVTAFHRTIQLRSPVLRVTFSALCFLLTPIGAQFVAVVLLAKDDDPAIESGPAALPRFSCTTYRTLRGLDAMPATVLFTPMDIGPPLLVYTHHSVVATGHHRNAAAMKSVLLGFISPPDQARPIVAATPADYLAYCPRENEVNKYIHFNRHSLMAALEQGRPPAWLVPVRMRPGETIRLYRIVRSGQLATKRIATPFMQ